MAYYSLAALDDMHIRQKTLARLIGGIWHSTHPERYRAILMSGAIEPEPDIPNRERWKTSGGPELYPYVRTLGGVSLFDFRDFDPEKYSAEYVLSDWWGFVPYRSTWGAAVWIEMEREVISKKFVSGQALIQQWKRDEMYRHTIMPLIEAAHLGPIPTSDFRSAFLVREGLDELVELDLGKP